jgi:prevent-host-death family protein
MEHDSNRKGNAAELAIAAEAAKLGLEVYYPLTEHGRSDLVFGIAGKFYRVQCKWASCKDGVIPVRLYSSYHSPTRGYVNSKYDASEVDLVPIYCGDNDHCYLVPAELFDGRAALYLRVAQAKNNQRAALNWASDYEFPGAVAQLAERSNGIRKVRGSIPLSSTPQAESTSTVETVGAHEFRNHFGYYMEQAAGGTEVLVSKRGRPFVRLLGTQGPAEEVTPAGSKAPLGSPVDAG